MMTGLNIHDSQGLSMNNTSGMLVSRIAANRDAIIEIVEINKSGQESGSTNDYI